MKHPEVQPSSSETGFHWSQVGFSTRPRSTCRLDELEIGPLEAEVELELPSIPKKVQSSVWLKFAEGCLYPGWGPSQRAEGGILYVLAFQSEDLGCVCVCVSVRGERDTQTDREEEGERRVSRKVGK